MRRIRVLEELAEDERLVECLALVLNRRDEALRVNVYEGCVSTWSN